VSGHEVLLALEWLTTTLNADSTLTSIVTGGIWRGSAPVEAVPPYIVMNLQAGSDITTMNGVRIYDGLLFQVKVIGPGTITTTLLAAANEIDSLLKRTSGAQAQLLQRSLQRLMRLIACLSARQACRLRWMD